MPPITIGHTAPRPTPGRLPRLAGALLLFTAAAAGAGEIVVLPRPLPDPPFILSAEVEGSGEIRLLCRENGSGGIALQIDGAATLTAAAEDDGTVVWRSYSKNGSSGVVPPGPDRGRRIASEGVSLRNIRVFRPEPPAFGDDFQRTSGNDGFPGWETASGTFSLASEARAEYSSSPFHAVARPGTNNRFEAFFGRADSLRYAAGFSFEYVKGRTVALGICRRSGCGYLLVLDGRKARLLSETPSGREPLAEAELPLAPGWHQLALAVERARVVGFLDTREILSSRGRSAHPGGRALIRISGGPVRIDDVFITPVTGSAREALAWWWGELARIRDVFRQDPGMAEWARITGFFVKKRRSDTIEGVTPLFPPFSLSFPLRFGKGDFLSLGTREAPSAWPRVAPEKPRRAVVSFQALPDRTLRILLDGREIARRNAPSGKPTYPFLSGPLAAEAARSFSFRSPNFRDFTFSRQPALWAPLSGSWKESSLWACNPRYSWYRGEVSPGGRIAMLRYKEALSSEFHIRVIAAVPMLGDQTPYYEFPVNIGVSFTDASGKRLDALFGLCDVPSLLAENGRVLASDTAFVVPGARRSFGSIKDAIHLTWFSLEVEHLGDGMRLIQDGREILSAETALRPPVSMTLFTVDNGVVLARVEIASPFPGPAAPPPPDTSALCDLVYRYLPPERSGLMDRLAERELSPLGPASLGRTEAALPSGRRILYLDFSSLREGSLCGHDGMEIFKGSGAPALKDTDLPGGDIHSGGDYLLAVKKHAGGLLLPLFQESFDLRDYPELRFSYRFPRRSRPGLIMVVNGLPVTAALVPQKTTAPLLGLRNDGRWRRTKIDLVRLARSAGLKENTPLVCSYLGLHDPDWTEHCRGDSISLDDVDLVPAVTPSEAPAGTGGKTLVRTGEKTWPVLVRSGPGKPANAPASITLSPRPDGTACTLSPAGNVSLETVRLDAFSGSARFKASPGRGLRFRDAKLTWRLPPGETLPGKEASFRVRALDAAGRAVSAQASVTLTPDLRRKGPRLTEGAVSIRFVPSLSQASFDTPGDWGEVSNRGGMFLLPHREENGGSCAVHRGNFNTWEAYAFLQRSAFDADHFPVLRFRYRLKKGVRGWLGARVGREVLAIFDSYNHRGYDLRRRTLLEGDGIWHTAVFDLRRVLGKYLFEDDEGRRIVEQVFTVTPHWRRSRDRVLRLDDVALFPARPERLEVKVLPPPDPDGFGGLSWRLDNAPEGEAPWKPLVKGERFSVKDPAAEGRFLHLRAFDGKGDPGPVLTVRLFPDPE